MYAVRTNCGGNDVTDGAGRFWSRDVHYFNGATAGTANAIAGAPAGQQALYQSSRYNFPPPGADFWYTLRLPLIPMDFTFKFNDSWGHPREVDILLNDVLIGHASVAADSNAAHDVVISGVDITQSDNVLKFHGTNAWEPLVCAFELVPSAPGNYDALIAAEPALVAWWKLAEPAAPANAADSKGTNVGTVNGGVTFGIEGPWQDTAAAFNGSTGYISVAAPAASFPIAAPLSVEAWFRSVPDQTWPVMGLCGWGNRGNTSQIALCRIFASAELNFFYGNAEFRQGGLPDFADGVWHHVVATYNGLQRQIFFDGVLIGTNIGTPGGNPVRQDVWLGQGMPGEYLRCQLAQVAVYNDVLTLAQIQSHFGPVGAGGGDGGGTGAVGDRRFRWTSPPVDLRAHDNGDGTYSLGMLAAQVRAAGDLLAALPGDPHLPFLLLKLNADDNTFSVARADAAARGGADRVVRLEGDPPLPFLLRSNGDGTLALATYAGAGAGGDRIWRPYGTSVPLRAHSNGDGTFSLAIVTGAATQQSGDRQVWLWGDPPLPFLAKANGDGTFSLAVYP